MKLHVAYMGIHCTIFSTFLYMETLLKEKVCFKKAWGIKGTVDSLI